MDKKEVLNEEDYEKAKRKVISTAIIILVVGILIGGSLIALGCIKSKEVRNQNEQDTSIRDEANIQEDIDETQEKIDGSKHWLHALHF